MSRLVACLFVLLAAPVSAQTPPKSVAAAVPVVGQVLRVTAAPDTITELFLRPGFATRIQLPEGVTIVNVAGGDGVGDAPNGQKLWPNNIDPASKNVLYIRPGLDDVDVNLFLTDNSGFTYPFMLRSRTNKQPHMLVIVSNPEATAKASAAPRFYAAEIMDQMKAELRAAHAAVDDAQQQATKAIDATRAQLPATLQHYRVEEKEPFWVTGMLTDGRFTFIKTASRETFTLYEMKDGKPSEVNFKFQDGAYVVPKVLERGFFVIGKKRLAFTPMGTGK